MTVKAKPILFNTEMTKAILNGKKTQTRRLIKPQPRGRLCYSMAGSNTGKWRYPSAGAAELWGEEFTLPKDLTEAETLQLWTPPCHTDDILWVREAWRKPSIPDRDGTGSIISPYSYKADCNDWYIDKTHWKPSIHMPKAAARIFLNVTNVRVKRLQDMDDTDAMAEGVTISSTTQYEGIVKNAFGRVWDSTIKPADIEKYGWNADPWVWVITFARCDKPEGWEE